MNNGNPPVKSKSRKRRERRSRANQVKRKSTKKQTQNKLSKNRNQHFKLTYDQTVDKKEQAKKHRERAVFEKKIAKLTNRIEKLQKQGGCEILLRKCIRGNALLHQHLGDVNHKLKSLNQNIKNRSRSLVKLETAVSNQETVLLNNNN